MPSTKMYTLKIILAFIPDLLVSWAFMKLTNDQWLNFWIALVALQLIYFFYWVKTALWSWVLFLLIGRRQMAAYLESYFLESRFPAPDEYAKGLDDYFSGMIANEKLDCNTRIRAAYQNGTLNGMNVSRRYSMLLQMNLAAESALKRYRLLAKRFAKNN